MAELLLYQGTQEQKKKKKEASTVLCPANMPEQHTSELSVLLFFNCYTLLL